MSRMSNVVYEYYMLYEYYENYVKLSRICIEFAFAFRIGGSRSKCADIYIIYI